MNKIVALAFAFIVVASAFIVTEVNGTTQNYGPVTISGPTKVAEGSNFTYVLSVQQIFTKYDVDMILTGSNLTGANPIYPQYYNGTFAPINFTITAPSVSTTLLLFFQVKGYIDGQLYFYNYTFPVSVVAYTTLHTVVKNPSGFNINYLNVSFYVNGNYVGSKVINITQNSTMTVTYNWLSSALPVGVYTVTVSLNNSLVKLTSGSTYTLQIQSGNPDLNYIYLGIAAFFIIIIVVLFISNYYARKRKPKWKK